VEQLGGEFDLHIVTLDRDKADSEPYAEISRETWDRVGDAWVMYCRRPYRPIAFLRLLKSIDPDVMYLNTFFSVGLTVMPILARLVTRSSARVVVAPRGELSPAGMRLKWWKKVPFLFIVSLSHIASEVTWQASTQSEADDISKALGPSAQVVVAANLQRQIHAPRSSAPKAAGLLRALFVSRVSRKKNLTYLLDVLMSVDGRVDLDIIGPTEDLEYWRQCTERIERLPEHIVVKYKGDMSHDLVAGALADHDLLVLPTMTENFGHVILESLSVGTPVLISDQTPWRNLVAHDAGWDIDLAHPEKFREALEYCVGMGNERFVEMSVGASEQARKWFGTGDALQANRRLFGTPHKRQPV
jgi:glycosyltransferase involved in cell wall biosynthesis